MSKSRPWDYWVLWLVALVSLAINVIVVRALLDARRQVGQAASAAAQAVGELAGTSILTDLTSRCKVFSAIRAIRSIR